jgi:tRNA dimethylallyltransferase
VPARVVVVAGATATGKSALALELAEQLGGEIVNADALQAYRRLDVGTGKPDAADRARSPHHLFDILEPEERYSAGDFARRARAVIAEIAARGRVALVVGGSGLYLRALLEGLAPLPPRDDRLRATLVERAEREGLRVLHAELAALDPAAAATLAVGDRQRIVRALEVALASGRALSQWIAQQPNEPPPFAATRIGLTLPRSVLYDRIGRRVRAMLAGGWRDEVEALLASGLGASVPAFQAIGYRQLVRAVLAGNGEAEVVGEITTATRRLAKRQETWFRRDPAIRWLDASGGIVALIEAALGALQGAAESSSGRRTAGENE